MDIHSHLEYLCRVCAANTKGKNSVAESVYILKSASLKDKLDKFLYLKISENDSLPKVLCKTCFRQVEATASLSKIARHTQQVFRDFLLSNLPKGPSESTNTSEFTSSDFMGNKDTNEKSKSDEIVVEPAAPTNVSAQLPAPAQTSVFLPPPPPPPLSQPSTTTSRKDEVVVNVSVTDPLTRDNQRKMISNSQRRQSLLIESRYTPKSIAQKPAVTPVAPRFAAPKPNQKIETFNTTNNSNAAASLLNFYSGQTQQPSQPTQITTFSSGGYVIGRINADKEEAKNITLPLAPPADVIQQKRKNLVKALNNIKANSSGQVSLLKSSQQKQAKAVQNSAKAAPSTEADNQAVEYELPEKIIIAAPKKKSSSEKSKKEPLNLSSKMPVSATPLPATTFSAAIAGVGQEQQEQSNAPPPKPAFPDDILLGRVIRDVDLLKLILKALKWPVNKQNMELQIQLLKSSKFTDIISDANLLQDTDLTQLLSPYLAPVLLAAQALQQQQQEILKNTTLKQNVTPAATAQPKMTALEAAQAEINKSIPYKLPPETSVQLVPATPEETEATQSPPPLPSMNTTTSTAGTLRTVRQKETKTTAASQKRQRKTAAQKARDSIIISDEEDASTEDGAPKKFKQHSDKAAPNIHIELNPNFLSQFNLLNGSGTGNEADELMALLLKQRAAVIKDKQKQRRRRNSVSNLISLPPNEFDALIDLDDDIVLMEPVTTTSSSETNSSNQVLQPPKTDITNTFVIPSVPLITRPIIKRRKTVIHPPKHRFDLSIELKNKDQPSISSTPVVQSKEQLMEETINQVATGNLTNFENIITKQAPSKAVNNESAAAAAVNPADLTITKTTQQKKLQNKSTLGQQLLEAIGLQTMPPTKIIGNPQAKAADSATLSSNAIAVLPNSKQSIQQIRTALKKSLKQAQEQQQQKNKELSSSASTTVIQDADSTTKPAIKEVVVVEEEGNKSDTCSSMVDVEEQIKVTLMVRKNDEQPTMNTTTGEKDGQKEVKKLPRRTLWATGTRGVGAHSITDNEKSNEGKTIADNETPTDDNQKLQKDDSANISSSSGAVSNVLSVTAAPATNDGVRIPKRRGRKRLVDKLLELEAAEAKERERERELAIQAAEDDLEDANHNNNNNNEEETEGTKTSGRPTRQSKTQSKYYKGPDKIIQGKRYLPSRTTRNR